MWSLTPANKTVQIFQIKKEINQERLCQNHNILIRFAVIFITVIAWHTFLMTIMFSVEVLFKGRIQFEILRWNFTAMKSDKWPFILDWVSWNFIGYFHIWYRIFFQSNWLRTWVRNFFDNRLGVTYNSDHFKIAVRIIKLICNRSINLLDIWIRLLWTPSYRLAAVFW